MSHDGDDDRLVGSVLGLIGLVGLIVIALLDWAAGDTVRRQVRQGDGVTRAIVTEYGWSGIPWREWEE